MLTRGKSQIVFLLSTVLLLSACGGGGGSSGDQGSPDRTAPVISINGASTVNHEQGTPYSDPGATATDAVDGSVSVATTGSVGTDAGTYTLTYTATDRAGNTATATRAVIVADTTAPVITMLGLASITHVQGTPFTDPGVSAMDTVDGSVVVVTTGSVDAAVGTYVLTYTARDAAGNSATASRTVVVEAPPPGTDPTDLLVFDAGAVDPIWDRGLNAFDAAIGFNECNNDGGAACPSISWQLVADSARGDVLQVTHAAAGDLAGLFIAANIPLDVTAFSGGSVVFDIKVISGDSNITMKLDCVFPCTSGNQPLGSKGAAGWETVEVPFATLVGGGLDLANVNTGIVIWATNATSTVFQLDNIRFTGFDDTGPPPTGGYTITAYGAGSISDTINPASYRCVVDFGNWIYNAGVVEPAIPACNATTGIPTGTPTPRHPQLSGPAVNNPTPTHKWWGSIPFLGEMTVGDPNDAAYITPDPITARISDRGVRVMGIPSGLASTSDGFAYTVPDPFSEVFDGIAIGNADFAGMDAYLKDHSDGSVTVEWQSSGQAVMEATFVHGSPYVYVKAYQGELVVRTLRADGGEKGTFYNQGNSLGIWTSVAGNHNNFLITGEGNTTFGNAAGNEIAVSNAANELTLTYLPQAAGAPSDAMTSFFEASARNIVAAVEIDYAVDRATNAVTVSHEYRDSQGSPIETVIGLHPLHWKNSALPTSGYQIRSARGIIKFAQTDSFDYQLPSVGVLPALPSINGTFDQATLEILVSEFVAQGPAAWNDRSDTYWAAKNYGKVAELIAIADAIGMNAEAMQLLDWLKTELADWFTAETNGSLDVVKYFVYDDEWNTLLGLEEAFASHQQLNDHHFHYGYFVRAAAEICRMDIAWCGADQYGPMIELLIRDYAGDADDPMFPYLRNFDPANGFSWASGPANFVRGNNNESTSEAANAYGAIILYGLNTGRDDLVEKGMYLHASTAAAYWQYWNNIDGYNNAGADADNFPPGYDRITTSIIWGDGAVFSTWFSGAFAHILGIQGLPSNPLILHVGQYSGYMVDYVTLGLSESANIRPSGLPDDQWRDLWWNLWAMTEADAAIADYETAADYVPEAGETKAHTYHWIHTFRRLGHMKTGTGALTSNYPAALAFDNNGLTSYVVYNFSGQARVVTFSDGQTVNAAPNGFTVITN
ncbi:MAG: glycosyl hydrolase [Gammaproteobacteria bacterium]|nr:glycosyl hydrolase [Gammaproteobacteria bacterium]